VSGKELPPISVPPTSETLRLRVLALMNGDSPRKLTAHERKRLKELYGTADRPRPEAR
jgi:hypothetical protein